MLYYLLQVMWKKKKLLEYISEELDLQVRLTPMKIE